MGSDLLFDVVTPLGFTVRCTREYWEFLVSVKHPALAGHEAEVRQALTDPQEIRRSRQDNDVYLFYRGSEPRWICAVAKHEGQGGFLITLPCGQDKDWRCHMDKIKVIHDTTAHTLTVWTGDPSTESVCEETSDEVVLMKDAKGHVIGFELLHFNPEKPELGLSVETLVHA